MKRLTKLENGHLKFRISGRHLRQLERAARTHNTELGL